MEMEYRDSVRTLVRMYVYACVCARRSIWRECMYACMITIEYLDRFLHCGHKKGEHTAYAVSAFIHTSKCLGLCHN